MITIWENTHCCAGKYRWTSVLYLISAMLQCYSGIIYQDITAPGNGKEVVYGLNDIDKHYIYIYELMSNIQIPGLKLFDSKMQIHTRNQSKEVCMAK